MRKLKFNNSKKGFTIIEVVLVLAIAGLIFLAIFIALPALQRSQRDAQKKQDIAALGAAFIRYLGNNKNQMPDQRHDHYRDIDREGADIGFLTGYWRPSSEFKEIEFIGQNYGYTEAVWVYYNEILVHLGGSCVRSEKGNWIAPIPSSLTPKKRRIAVYAILENEKFIKHPTYANVGANYCQEFGG